MASLVDKIGLDLTKAVATGIASKSAVKQGALASAYSKYGPLVTSSLYPSSPYFDDRAFAIEQAQKQMDFQERMSNTAYQRATNDLIKAVLNPGLLYSASAASSPAGSMATTPATATSYQMNRENNSYKLMDTTLKGLFQTLNTALSSLMPRTDTSLSFGRSKVVKAK